MKILFEGKQYATVEIPAPQLGLSGPGNYGVWLTVTDSAGKEAVWLRKTMAMHKSEQLPETAQVLFEQFAVLGEIPDRISIGVYNEELGVSEWWVTDQQGIQITHKFKAPLYEPTHAKMLQPGKREKKVYLLNSQEMN